MPPRLNRTLHTPDRAVGDGALVAAGVTPQPTALDRLDQRRRRLVHALRQQLLQPHRSKYRIGRCLTSLWLVPGSSARGPRIISVRPAPGSRLIDQYGPANPRASSGDHSRILRCGYGADGIYSEFARRSLIQWRALDERSRASLWHACGVLLLAAADDPYFIATRETLQQGGYAMEELDAPHLRARYPHLDASDIAMALVEPECGVLMARRAVRTLVEELVQSGTEYLRGRVAVVPSPGPVKSLLLADGAGVSGDAFVFACGPWLPSVFRATLDGLIRPTRQNVIYFGAPPGDDRFGPAHTPAWIDRPAGIYGIPDLEDCGVKVGIDEHGPPIDPDLADRTPDAGAIARARAWVERRFPAMQGAPVVETRVCQVREHLQWRSPDRSSSRARQRVARRRRIGARLQARSRGWRACGAPRADWRRDTSALLARHQRPARRTLGVLT